MSSPLVNEQDPMDHDLATNMYQAYLKKEIREHRTPLNPNQWLNAHLAKAQVQAPKPTLVKRPAPQKHETLIREQFIAMMIDNGITNNLSLMESARHRMALGDERPMTVKQTTPCIMCGDILCRWAR